MQTEGIKYNGECNECMYCKEENFCIRRQKKVKGAEICLHFVRGSDRHSLDKLIELMGDILLKDNE